MTARKAKARPKRASKETSREVCERIWRAADALELQKTMERVAAARDQLRNVLDDLAKAASYIDVCIDALRTKGRDDSSEDIALVLIDANERLVDHVADDVESALKALGGGK